MIFVDNFTTMTWIEFLREKHKAFDKLKIFKSRVETKARLKIRCLRSNRGESLSNEFNNFCEDNGIKR